jgi:hypothetical protein
VVTETDDDEGGSSDIGSSLCVNETPTPDGVAGGVISETDGEESAFSNTGRVPLCVNETQHSDNNQEDDIVGDGGSSYEVDAEAGVGAGGPASGLVSQRPQTPVLKTKKRALTGATRKAAKKARERGGGFIEVTRSDYRKKHGSKSLVCAPRTGNSYTRLVDAVWHLIQHAPGMQGRGAYPRAAAHADA